MNLRRLLAGAALLLLTCTAAAAVDPSLFQDLRWRLVGPFRGGRALAVTGVPGEPQHFYFGGVDGGVWETRDAGRTWQPIFDHQSVASIGAIAVAPSDPRVIYVGTGEADMRSDIAQGDGMYRSSDGGRSWQHIGLEDSQQIGRILVDPADPNLVYVAALGHPYAANPLRGVFRSRDGGQTWQRVLGRLRRNTPLKAPAAFDSDTGAIDLVFEPGNSHVLYAALWQTRRTPWSIYPPSNGAGSGLFKSTDGGDSWNELRSGLPANPGRIGIAVAPSDPKRVYAIIDAREGGMYRSDDAGMTWTRVGSDDRVWGRGWYFGGITVEPKNADIVYSCNVNEFQSNDGGRSWFPAKGAPGGDDYHSLWIDPDHPERRILGVDQGTVVSVDGGATWSSWFNQPTGQFYHVVTDNRFPYWIYGAQQDSGAAGVPSRTSTIDGISMMSFREVTAGGESDNIAPDPRDPDILYGGRVERLNLKTGQTQQIDPMLGESGIDRHTWTLPLVFSHRDPSVLYFSNQRLYRTADGGRHWTRISDDLTRTDPGAPSNLDPTTAVLVTSHGPQRGVIYAISPSRTADHDIWVGTDDGLVWRTRDEGGHWQNVTPPSLTPWSKVGIIETSPFDAETAYVAVDRHRLDDVAPYIYRTRDGGKSWELIVNGIAGTHFVNVVREDPVQRGLLYAGTERGMYVSFDDGGQWQPLQMNLPVTSIRDIDVHGNDVVIATHGRAFWVLDDVSPIRQASAAASALSTSGTYLFRPATAIRFREAGFTGSPMPKDEPMAPNPPAGAAIDYALARTPSTPVTLDIVDEKGQTVRHYASDMRVPAPDPAKLHTAVEWFVTPSFLQTTPGMHRFIWPIRMAAQPALAGRNGAWTDGVWVPPGTYQVVLTVDGQRSTQPLVVAPDPRIDLPPDAYQQQFELARQVSATQAAVHKAFEESGTVLKRLRERRSGATGALATAIDEAERRVRGLSESSPPEAWWLSPERTDSLRFLDGQLAKLAGAVDGADAAPTPDARAGYAAIVPVADNAAAAWESFKATVLAPLNEQLAKSGRPAIEVTEPR